MTDAPRLRRQLTLFVPPPEGQRLDALRSGLDPVQAGLIAAHVTLCREDEIEALGWPLLRARIRQWRRGGLTLAFGPAERFHGHGILRPCTGGQERFQALRRWLLQDDAAREHPAHLTLAHPRNPRAAGNSEAAFEACAAAPPLTLSLDTVSLIEQAGAAPWRCLGEAALRRPAAAEAGIMERPVDVPDPEARPDPQE